MDTPETANQLYLYQLCMQSRTCQEQWTTEIDGERELRDFELSAQFDAAAAADDDDDDGRCSKSDASNLFAKQLQQIQGTQYHYWIEQNFSLKTHNCEMLQK